MARQAITHWCPSLEHTPRQLRADSPGFWRCPACGTRHSACLVKARPELFREPVAGLHPGYDPVTGIETQDLPR